MKCTDKEWDTCQVEKMGCKGCYYDKIEIDEYIRNKAGYIGKVKKIIEPDEYITERYYCCETTMASEYRSQIIKHSNQLIDLMEVGDVIKYKIENVALETRGYLEGITDISDKEMLRNIRNDKNYKVLEILTKEMFEEDCLKVGE